MRIVHIVAGLPPGSGIATVVPCLCARLRALGHEVMIVTLSGPLSETAQAAGVRVVQMRAAWPRFLFFSWQMLRQLPALCREADVVHVHSCWTFPVWWGCRCALRAGKPLVMSPHGCLDPVRLRHAGWKKRLVGWLDRGFLRRAAAVHATSAMEREWAERFLRPRSGRKGEGKRGGPRVVVVPNGVLLRPLSGRNGEGKREERPLRGRNGEGKGGAHPREKGLEKGDASFYPRICDHSVVAKRTVLYLGRLHPLKGLDLLVEAWARVRAGSQPETPHGKRQSSRPSGDVSDWRLIIAGPDEQGTRAALERQARERGVLESIEFLGPVYGAEKDRLLESVDLFVLPSRSENFGLVVAEALAAGVPVIATQAAPWAVLEDSSKVLKFESSKVKSEELTECNETCSPFIKHVQSTSVQPNARTLELSNFRTSRCGWWAEVGVEPLVDALREAMSLTREERARLGENGRRLVEAKYRWEAIVERMEAVYLEATRS